MQLDHAVINVHYQMDQAKSLFTALGFCLTDRGYHSLGSINHSMMFSSDYLELVGLPAETKRLPPQRPEILASPPGINGLVFKSDDIDETWDLIQSLGMADAPPRSFSRPVELASGEVRDAHFRTVTVKADVFPAGRVYFCQHLTPDLLWRPEWQTHDNGTTSIVEFVIVSEAHEREAEDMGRLLQRDVGEAGDRLAINFDGGQITLMSPGDYKARYGTLASSLEHRPSIFGALVLRTDDLSTIREHSSQVKVPVIDGDGRFSIRLPEFDAVLEFVK